MSVDTLSLARTLREVELTGPQAGAIAMAIGIAVDGISAAHGKPETMDAEIRASFSDLVHRRSVSGRWFRHGDHERSRMNVRPGSVLRAAWEINPMNDWFLARMVAVQVITGCAIIIALKL